MAGNTIKAESVLNPSGVLDTCSHITTTKKSDLVISKCMPYIDTYTFQFWIKSKSSQTVIFTCDDTMRKIKTTSNWQYFTVTFTVKKISNIVLTFPKNDFWIYNTKLEIGTVPTDWSPHPEDGNTALSELDAKVEQLISQTTTTIDNITSMTDKLNMTIENSLTRTEFQTNINGIVNGINENLEQLQEGMGMWHVSVYRKSDFEKLTKMPTESTDWSDIDALTNAMEHGGSQTPDETQDNTDDTNTGDNTGDSGSTTDTDNPSSQDPKDPDYESPIDDYNGEEEEEIDDRERYDIKVFSMQNGDINPMEEMLVHDDPISMRIEGKGKVLYYYTFAKFSKNVTKPLNCSFRKSSCYLNGVMLVSDAIADTMDITFDFKAGWNIIEIVSNEGNFSFNQSISKLPECMVMNCLVATPTSRSVKTRIKSSGIYQSLDRIMSEVYEYEDEIYMDNGVTKKRKVLKGSRIKQTADLISLMVKNIYGDYSQLDINPTFIQAITQKFEIVDQRTGRKVVVKDGKLQANSIDTYMLSTNALASRNYDGGTLTERYVIDNQTGETTIVTEADINFDPENNIIFPEHGTFYDLYNGNIYSPNFVLINDYHKSLDEDEDGEFDRIIDVHNKAYFKGTIYATNSQFSGRVISKEGEIGPWHITTDSIYKGSHQLGAKGFGNAYLGDAGMSLGNSFVYNSQTGNLDLRVNSLQITGPDAYQLVSQAINGNTIYYTYGVPSLTNAPSNAWNAGEYSIHLNELCYDINTGKLYRFEKKRNNYASDDEVNSTLYVITFDSDSELRSGAIDYIDYVEIFYEYNKKTYKVATTLASNNSFSLPIVIPTDSFYVYLHITESETIVDYYGFTIESVTPTTGNATPTVEISNNQTVHKITAEDIINSGNVTVALNTSNLPNYPIDRSLEVGEFPETEHPYVHAETDIIWYVRSGVGSLQSYQWVEIENAELTEAAENARKALTFMYYDATNGFILHNGLHTLPDGLIQDGVGEIEGGNVRLTSSGVNFYNGNTKLAEYGANTIFYGLNSNNQMVQKLFIGQDGVAIKDGVFMLGWNNTIQDYLFKVYDNGNFLFGDDSGLATSPTNNNYIKWNNQTGRFIISADAVSIGKEDVAQSIARVNEATEQIAEDFEDFLDNAFDDLYTQVQNQEDSKAQVWKQPSTQNPANNWSVDSRPSHEGDIWYQTDMQKMYIFSATEGEPGVIYYGWTEMKSTPPDAVMSVLNDKANIFMGTDTPTGTINEGDLWFRSNQDPIKIWNGLTWIKLDYYLDSTDFTNFVEGAYANEIEAVHGQIDQKMQTWKQASPPDITEEWVDIATSTNNNLKENHLYDIWLDISAQGTALNPNGTYKTYVYDTTTNQYKWEIMNVEPPQHIIDNIDGKATVYVGTTVTPQNPSPGDLWFKGADQPIYTWVFNTTAGTYVWEVYNNYTDDSALNTFINGEYLTNKQVTKGLIDGKIETFWSDTRPDGTNGVNWYGGTPSTDNRTTHIGDIWYDTTVQKYKRYNYNESTGVYSWEIMEVEPPQAVMDTIDGKCKAFYSTQQYPVPVPPYQIGDIWLNATYVGENNTVIFQDDIVRCIRAKNEGQSFSIEDWQLASKYTDDSSLRTFRTQYEEDLETIQGLIDGRIETFWGTSRPDGNNGEDWTAEEKLKHIGDIWYDATDQKYKRYNYNADTQVYSWDVMEVEPPQAVFDKIDGKCTAFYTSQSTPVPTVPYNTGDLWMNATYSITQNGETVYIFNNDIARCVTSKTVGQSFDINDWQLASRYTDNSALQDFIRVYTANQQNMQGLLDGKMQTYWSATRPDGVNSVNWNMTEDLREQHIGDIWYDTVTLKYKRYNYDEENDTYDWGVMEFNPPQEIFDQIDGKCTAFYSSQDHPLPTVPYNEGDIWMNASYTDSQGHVIFNNDIVRCTTSKTAQQSFNIADWELASKYTDDTELESFLTQYTIDQDRIEGLIDGKVETFWGANIPSTNWDNTAKAKHVGDMWYDTIAKKYKIYDYNETNQTYSWVIMDVDPPQDVFDLIDGKCVAFYSTSTVPTPTLPYHKGDIWMNATYTTTQNGQTVYIFKNDICRSITDKTDPLTQQFDINDWVLASRYTDDSELDIFKTTYIQDQARMQGLIDGKLETFWMTTRPDGTNGILWTSPNDIRDSHVGDIWYDMTNQVYKTFTKDTSNNTYSWETMEVPPPADIMDAIDGKARVFITDTNNPHPTPAYDIGDIWMNATYVDSTTQEVIFDNDIARCRTARAEGQSFNISDWVIASKYTDNSELYEFQSLYKAMMEAVSKQADGVAQTYSSNTDPSASWTTASAKSGHVGDIWENTNNNKYYIYVYSEPSNNYKWMEVDNLPIEYKDAVNRGAKAFVTEINQSTHESNLPQPPYKEGDLWLNATFTYLGHKYDNEIMVCCNSKALGQTASGGDWVLASKYTGDDKAIEVEKELEHHKNWYGTGVPTMSNYPVNTWSSSEYDNYIGSQYTDNSTGKTYRFYKNNNVYGWAEIQDIDIPASALVAKNFSIQTNKWGLVISNHKLDDDAGIEALTDSNIRINSNGMHIYNGQTILASYGSGVNFYKVGTSNVAASLSASGFSITDGLAGGIHITDSSIYSGSHSTFANENDVAGFYLGADGKLSIGNSNSYIKYDGSNVTMKLQSLDLLATQVSSMQTTISTINDNYDAIIQELGQQSDNQIQTWYQSADPSTSWTTSELKTMHTGDLWFSTSNGLTYRWNGTAWNTTTTNPPQSVFDSIDGKATIYTGTTTPSSPSSGDLWFKGATEPILTYVNNSWITYNKYTDDTGLNNFINNTYSGAIQSIQQQADSKAQTWYQDEQPGNSWTTTEKANHVGDFWYKTSTGKYYIYSVNNGTYSWTEMKVEPPTAIVTAINGKANIFVGTTTPSSPKSGDLWFKGANEPILTYVNNSWTTYNKYTDDSSLNNFINNTYSGAIQSLQQQADKKAETWYQSTQPGSSWTTAEKENHIGDFWYNTSNTKYYIYSKEGSTYSWIEMKTEPPTAVMTAINGKANIFVGTTTPSSPKTGDLWFKGNDQPIYTYTGSSWVEYNNYSTQATNASKTATSYLNYTANGLIISSSASNYSSYPYINLSSTGLDIYSYHSTQRGIYKCASYGKAVCFYDYPTDNLYEVNVQIDSSGLFAREDLKIGIGLLDSEVYLDANGLVLNNSKSIKIKSGSINIKDYTLGYNGSQIWSDVINIDGNGMKSAIYQAFETYCLNEPMDYTNGLGLTVIDHNGNLNYSVSYTGSVSQASDERMKNIISNLKNDSYKDLFMSINPISYTWKDRKDSSIHFGVGAQTLQKSIEDLGYSNLSLVNNSDDKNLSANYTEILMLSVPVVQEHETEIQKLKLEIESLKGEIKRLKGR